MSYMDDIQGDIGETTTLSKVTEGGLDKWGHATTSSSTTTVNGYFEIMTQEDDEVEEGRFKSGELRVFFDSTVSNINNGNIIKYKGRDYEIIDTIEEPSVEDQSHIMIRAKPV